MAASLILSACATISSKTDKYHSNVGHPYSGTQCEINIIDLYSSLFPPLLPFLIIDLPLSLVADTLILPVDLAKFKSMNAECGGIT
jgi:uncharacterized protein YceK